jgi:retron-type reverse transcriptase
MIFKEQTKSIPITKMVVWEAYKKVKSNKGSAGVDQQTLEDFDKVRSKELYKIWNRLASGSYFPPEVKRVEIRKQDGKTRPLGIPKLLSYYFITVSCRNVFARTNIRIDSIF